MDYYDVIENALIYIEDHLHQPLSLESVASTFHMSKFYFHRLFSAMMGSSLNQYILSRRLNASLRLMSNENLSLTDITYQLNFGTPSSFSRAFKRQYGIAPSTFLKGNGKTIAQVPIPSVVKRPLKNINGDLVTDFTLTEFETIRLCGIAFEVDLTTDYKTKIRTYSETLLNNINNTINGSCYVIYSNCQPNSTRFKVLFGVPSDIKIDQPYFFTIDVPELFCAKFNYSGDILDIGDILKTDFARFLKISKQEPENSDIELIQVFDNIHHLNSAYHIYTPIKKLPIDFDD